MPLLTYWIYEFLQEICWNVYIEIGRISIVFVLMANGGYVLFGRKMAHTK
jgi:hypothetical protein